MQEAELPGLEGLGVPLDFLQDLQSGLRRFEQACTTLVMFEPLPPLVVKFVITPLPWVSGIIAGGGSAWAAVPAASTMPAAAANTMNQPNRDISPLLIFPCKSNFPENVY